MAGKPLSLYVFIVVLIRRGFKYLLVQEAKQAERGRWYLPAGAVRAGEELKAAAVREVASSSGLDIEVTGLVSIEHMPRLPGWEFARFRFVVEARVLPTSGPPCSEPNEDSLKAEFFMPSEIESLPLRGKDAIRLISKHASGQPVASIDDIYHVGLS